jgi:hypothetical protein
MSNGWPRPQKAPDPNATGAPGPITEAVALGKICPIRTILHMEQPPLDGYPGSTGWNQTHPYCSGSACMWWRWAQSPPAPANTGFCGAAGAP